MKRIQTSEAKERKEKRLRIIAGSVIIFLLVVSSLGYALVFGGNIGGGSSTQADPVQTQYETNPDGSYFNGRYWIYSIGGQDQYFSYPYDEVADIPVESTLTAQNYAGQQVYIVGEDNALSEEIALNMQRFAGRIQQACLGYCEEDLPEKTCDDLVIVIEAGENPSVTQDNNCAYITGDMRAVDAYLFSIFGAQQTS